MGSKADKIHEACPYCLTAIKLNKKSKSKKKSKIERKQPVKARLVEKESEQTFKVDGCAYSFGYLSKRSPKEEIPEECLTCGKILECML